MRLIIVFLFLIAPAWLSAQEETCPDSTFIRLIREGKYYQNIDFQKAFHRFNAAKYCRPEEIQYVDKLIFEMFQIIEGQREEAKKQARLTEFRAKEAEDALKRLEVATEQIYNFLIEDIENLLYSVNFQAALEKINLAIPLAKNPRQMEKYLLEIAYVFNEAGLTDQALKTLDLLYTGLRNTIPPRDRASDLAGLRREIQSLYPAWFDTLHTFRYALPDMVFIEEDTFLMGCDTTRGDRDCKEDEFPPHHVALSDFYLAKTETTVWQFSLFCLSEGENIRVIAAEQSLGGDKPITNLNWNFAARFANWASKRMGWNEVYLFDQEGNLMGIDYGASPAFRLPTEAQWEYAARGGKYDSPSLFAGSDTLDEVGWYWENSAIDGVPQPHPVKTRKPNELGLFDMSGNVWEWCQDIYGGATYYADCEKAGIVRDPKGPGPEVSNYRVIRSGTCRNDYLKSRVSNREYYFPLNRLALFGFRLSMQ